MAKKKVYGVFDTETIGVSKKWIYDLGLVVVEKTGNPLAMRRWRIKETLEIPGIEKKAYYGAKIPVFYSGLPMVTFATAKAEFNQMLEKMGVTTITAYNLQFDMMALRATLDFTGDSREFLNLPYEYFDLWNAACDSFFQQANFRRTAIKEEWVSEAGNFRTNAEIAYRYRTGNFQFMETHTALEDAEVEAVILQEVLRQKKKIIRNELVANPWRKVQSK